MFHPTAYENFKVIIEGSVYDADFTGDIRIVNRSETVDLSILARRYEIQFVLPDFEQVKGSIVVAATLAHQAEELLFGNEEKAAANIEIHFAYRTTALQTNEYVQSLSKRLLDIWGEDRHIDISASEHYRNGEFINASQKVIVSFNRIVTENQADDLYQLVNYVVSSLEEIKKDSIHM
ncbi:MAG: hypothetical protein ACI35R_01205 [Bacillus sp. (in: firmicutes)]